MPAHTALRLALALGALALAAGCAPTRVDAVRVPLPLGTWYATITNGASDCGSESWREGETSSGVEVSIEAGATEGALVAHVRGLVGGLLYLGYGTAQFDGGLERSRLRLALGYPRYTGNQPHGCPPHVKPCQKLRRLPQSHRRL